MPGTPEDDHILVSALNGNDTVDGGDGHDTLAFDSDGTDLGVRAVFLPDGSADYAFGQNAGNGGFAASGAVGSFLNIEEVQGTENGDLLDASQIVGSVALTGGAGSDVLVAGMGETTLSGGQGDDLIIVQAKGQTVIDGGDGFDSLAFAFTGEGAGVNLLLTDETGGTYELGEGTGSFTSVEGFHGTVGDDVIDASAATGGVLIDGSDGHDEIFGGVGDDTLFGGDGDDRMHGGDGADIMEGGSGDDLIVSEDGDDTVDGGAGNDTLFTGSGDDRVTDMLGDNYVDAGDGNDSVTTGDGSDMIHAGWGDDTVDAGGGDDAIYADHGADLIYGGAGYDTIYGGWGGEQVSTAPPTWAQVAGVSGIITGTAGNPDFGHVVLSDGNGVAIDSGSVVSGGGENAAPGYHLGGGDNPDETHTHEFDQDIGSVRLHLAGLDDGETVLIQIDGMAVSIADLVAEGRASFDPGDTGYSVNEEGAIIGADAWALASQPAVLVVHGPMFAFGVQNLSDGGQGDGVVYRLEVDSNPARVYVPDGADTIYGGDDGDEIHAGSGDLVYGGTGGDDYDTLHVNDVAGIDFDPDNGENGTVHFNDGTSLVFFDIERIIADGTPYLTPDWVVEGTSGDDLIDGDYTGDPSGDMVDGFDNQLGGDADLIYGYGGDDTIFAVRGDDTVFGGAGDDSIDGGAGNDSLYGDDGADTITGGQGDDTLFGGDGNDLLSGGTENDTLYGGAGDDTLYGGTGDDLLSGGDGADLLLGEAGDDTLHGDDGDDTLAGGAGQDTIFGGAGNDLIFGGNPVEGGAGTVVFAGTNTAMLVRIENIEGTATSTIVGPMGTVMGDIGMTPDGTLYGVTMQSQLYRIDTDTGAGTYLGNFPGSVGFTNSLSFDENGIGYTGGNSSSIYSFNPATPGSASLWWTNPNGGQPAGDFIFVGNTAYVAWSNGLYALSLDAGNQVTGSSYMGTLPSSAYGLTAGHDGTLYVLGQGGAGNGLYRLDVADATGSGPVPATYVPGTASPSGIYWGATSDAESQLGQAADGADYIDAGAGDDTVHGLAGNDTILGGSGNDQLHGDQGDDQLSGGDGNDALFGGVGHDLLSGDAGDDTLSGGDGDDTLYGGDGNDLLDGNAGDDQVFGGDGRDQLLIGGAGQGADSAYGGEDRDTITVRMFAPENDGMVVDGGGNGGEDDWDTLDLTGAGPLRVIPDAPGSENGRVDFLNPDGSVAGSLFYSEIENVIPCFTPGTGIVTDRGEVPVQDLLPGDLVLTRDDGFQPLLWVGRRDLAADEMSAHAARLAPVRIARGALGPDLPQRDMMVSPQHRMLLAGPRAELLFGDREVLVPALHMVGQPGITRAVLPRVSYIHLLFQTHQIVHSDGLWSESFQPGAMTLGAMGRDQRDEILTLFPEIAQGQAYAAARMTLKSHESRALLSA